MAIQNFWMLGSPTCVHKDSKVLGASGDFEVELVKRVNWGGRFDWFIYIYIHFFFYTSKKDYILYIGILYIYKIACSYGVLIGFDCCLYFLNKQLLNVP